MPTTAKNLDVNSYAIIRAMPFAAAKIRFTGTLYDPQKSEIGKKLQDCFLSFQNFLPYWKFINRESGEIRDFSELWEGQTKLAQAMEIHEWLFALKAGKLGFSEMECAYDGYCLLFKTPRSRVHIFSKDADSAKGFLRIVKFGLDHLPDWMRPEYVSQEAGGETSESLILRVPWTKEKDPDDKRQIISFATSENVAIDQSAMHSHIDELSHWKADPKVAYQAIQSTVAPTVGTLHIVTRGAGDKVYTAELWHLAKKKESKLFPLFVPYDKRPRKDKNGNDISLAEWRKQEEENFTVQGLSHFAPMTEEDALAGDETAIYIPKPIWLGLAEKFWEPGVGRKDFEGKENTENLIPRVLPGDKWPCILALDAGVSNDNFAAILVARDPRDKYERVVVQKVMLWKPENFPTLGRIDYEEVEREIRMMVAGGCKNGHPRGKWQIEKKEGCALCGDAERKSGDGYVPPYNIICITYDPYQLEDMMQRFTTENLTWCDPFNQGTPRLIADRDLWNAAMHRKIIHDGNEELTDHITNTRAKLQKDEESKMRMIKKADHLKIDLAVATSMANYMCMFLNL